MTNSFEQLIKLSVLNHQFTKTGFLSVEYLAPDGSHIDEDIFDFEKNTSFEAVLSLPDFTEKIIFSNGENFETVSNVDIESDTYSFIV